MSIDVISDQQLQEQRRADAWKCVMCRRAKMEKPGKEHQLLFPGCGSVCGFQVRICDACWNEAPVLGSSRLSDWTPQELQVIYKNAHEDHHRRHPPEPPTPVHIVPLPVKEKKA